MKVPLLDLSHQHAPIQEALVSAAQSVVEGGCYIGGDEVRGFESDVADLFESAGTRVEAVSCASGSDALLLSLMALGVGPGDEVITTPFTFIATWGAISRLGATPVPVDIDPESFNLDPAAIAGAITSATRAIMPVDLFGQCASLGAIADAAGDIPIVEDAAQSLGAKREGHLAGSEVVAGCFSFYPTKNLGGLGDGGLIVTRDKEFAAELRVVASHGGRKKYIYERVGMNSRLDAIQAAMLRVKLPHLNEWSESRRQNAVVYGELFGSSTVGDRIVLPRELPGCLHVYNQYVLRVPERDALRTSLGEKGIGTEVYYPVALHVQEAFADLGWKQGAFPAAERATEEALAVPIYPGLTVQQMEVVVSAIEAFYA